MKQISKFILKHNRIIASLAFGLLLFTIFFSVNTGQAHAINLAYVPTDIQSEWSTFDQASGMNCFFDYGPARFGQSEWQWMYDTAVGPQDDASSVATAINAEPGQSLNIGVISMNFICHGALNGQPQFGVGASPYDSSVDAAFGAVNGQIQGWTGPPSPINLSEQTAFELATPTPTLASGPSGGTAGIVTSAVGPVNTQLVDFNNATRYWYPEISNDSNFNYTAPTVPGDYVIDFKLNAYEANFFCEGSIISNNPTNCSADSYYCDVAPDGTLTQQEYNASTDGQASLQSYCPTPAPSNFLVYLKVEPPAIVQSNIFTVNQDGSGQAAINGIGLQTCGYNSSVTQGANNWYYFTVPYGNSYCEEVESTPYSGSSPSTCIAGLNILPYGNECDKPFIPGYDGPLTRPYNVGGSDDAYPSLADSGQPATLGTCGPFGAANLQSACHTSSYQCQIASIYATTDACNDSSFDRVSDTGLDIDYPSLQNPGQAQPPAGSTPPATIPPNSTGPAPTCSLTPSGSPQADQAYTISYKITNNAIISPLEFNTSGDPYGVTFRITSGSGLSQTPPPNGTIVLPGSTSSAFTLSSSGAPGGQYTVVMYITDSLTGAIGDCSTTLTIANRPYLKVFGGNVEAGVSSTQIASCYNTSATILGQNEGTGLAGYGAGTSTASLATGSIDGFASGQNILNGLDPLTFANNSGTYGGAFGTSGLDCSSPTDYASVAPELPGYVGNCPNPITITVIPSGGYVCTYNSASTPLVINQNISYNVSGTFPYPNFEIVVTGGADLNIASSVTQLAGTYIDEGGTINDTSGSATGYSCPASAAPDDANNTKCASHLTIEGSFVANKIDFYRSYGTLEASTNCTAPSSTCDQYDAEEFDYSPLNWLVPGNIHKLNVQAITSLPPVL
jgi:hypothetical protein